MRCALGFRAHSGWAVLVAVTEPLIGPAIEMRRTITTADTNIAGSKQPFHAAEKLPFKQAEKHINLCTESSRCLARDAVQCVVRELHDNGHQVIACGALLASNRQLPALESILASHALIHAAEGELFRKVIIEAAEHCEVPVVGLKEKELLARCEAELAPRRALDKHLAQLGRVVGPPWRQDEKLATLAAWLALASSAKAGRWARPKEPLDIRKALR